MYKTNEPFCHRTYTANQLKLKASRKRMVPRSIDAPSIGLVADGVPAGRKIATSKRGRRSSRPGNGEQREVNCAYFNNCRAVLLEHGDTDLLKTLYCVDKLRDLFLIFFFLFFLNNREIILLISMIFIKKLELVYK